MRILIIISSREIGGAELYVERLVRSLSHACAFSVLLFDHTNATQFAGRLKGIPNCDVIVMPYAGFKSLPAFFKTIRSLAKNYDVVHINSNHPASRIGISIAFAMLGLSTPFITVEHSVTPMGSIVIPKLIAPFLPLLFRISRQAAYRVIVVSQNNLQYLLQNYYLPNSKCMIVYNGIDVNQQLAIDINYKIPYSIVVLGRLLPSKGHQFLIEAIPQILTKFPEVSVGLAGNQSKNDLFLQQIIYAFKLDRVISLLGFRNDVPDLLAKADMFVLPSLAEGFSLSIIEAMAAGCLVIATQVGGAAEIIENGVNGFLVPSADSAALSTAINNAFSLESEVKNTIRKNAMQTAQQFSAEKMAQNTLAVYREALKQHP